MGREQRGKDKNKERRTADKKVLSATVGINLCLSQVIRFQYWIGIKRKEINKDLERGINFRRTPLLERTWKILKTKEDLYRVIRGDNEYLSEVNRKLH